MVQGRSWLGILSFETFSIKVSLKYLPFCFCDDGWHVWHDTWRVQNITIVRLSLMLSLNRWARLPLILSTRNNQFTITSSLGRRLTMMFNQPNRVSDLWHHSIMGSQSQTVTTASSFLENLKLLLRNLLIQPSGATLGSSSFARLCLGACRCLRCPCWEPNLELQLPNVVYPVALRGM